MVKAWFNELGFDVIAHIEYTNKGRPIKPYLSSLSVILNAEYDGKDKGIEIAVFPRSGKIEVEYRNNGKSVVAKSPVEYTGIPNFSSIGKALEHMDIPDYLKRVLKIIADNVYVYDNPLRLLSTIKVIQDEIQDLSNATDDLPKITQTVKMDGTIFDKNDYSKDLGRVNIIEYFTVNDETEYEVSDNWFAVQQSDDGELMAIEETGGKEVFNPTYQEILDAIVPSQKEFEDLVELVKDVIREGEVEFGEKNTY